MTEKNTDGVGDQEEIIIYRAKGLPEYKGARALWYARLVEFEGRPLKDFMDSVEREHPTGRGDPTRDWLRFFYKQGRWGTKSMGPYVPPPIDNRKIIDGKIARVSFKWRLCALAFMAAVLASLPHDLLDAVVYGFAIWCAFMFAGHFIDPWWGRSIVRKLYKQLDKKYYTSSRDRD